MKTYTVTTQAELDAALASAGIDIWLVDSTNPAQETTLYYHRSRMRSTERALPVAR